MARWEPDARGRLEKAAMELFAERGYARATVGEIAERAGLTERTFFRYFSDKREVLFSRSAELEARIAQAVAGAPRTTAPFDAVVDALAEAGAFLQASRDMAYVRARFAIVVEHAEVRERELIKMASLAAAVAGALRARGAVEPEASLVAEAGIAVFKIGFESWVSAKRPGDLAERIRAAAYALRGIAASSGASPAASSGASPAARPKRASR